MNDHLPTIRIREYLPALACAACLALAPASAPGAEVTNANRRVVTLQECFSMALSNNLDLQIERLTPVLAKSDLEIALAGYEPTFDFSGRYSKASTGAGLDQYNRVYPGSTTEADSYTAGLSGLGPMGLGYTLAGNARDSWGTASTGGGFDTSSGASAITLTQPLLKNFIIDGTRYNIKVARNRVKESDVRLENQIINVITDVEQAYYNLIWARESVKVQEESLRLAEKQNEEDRKRFQIGVMARLEEKQSESEVAASRANLSQARNVLDVAENQLKRLLTADYASLHDTFLEPAGILVAVPHFIDLQESWRVGLTQRPDLRQARLEIERQGITIKYNKNQMLPRVDLVGSYGRNASGASKEFRDVFASIHNGDEPNWYVGGVLSYPLGNTAARERYKSSKVVQQQLLLTLRSLEETAMVQIDELIGTIRTTLDRVSSTREARIYAEEALEAEQTKFNAGKSTTFVVLRLQRDLTSRRTDEINALAEYNKGLAALHKAEGTTLKERNIGVELK